MSDHEDELDFTPGEATFPMQVSALKDKDYVMLKGRPCKIKEISKTTAGKHGHSKVTIVGDDLFTDQEHEDVVPGNETCNVPNVERKEYNMIDVKDGVLTIMDVMGETREIKSPTGDLGNEIKTRYDQGDEFDVSVLSACGEERVCGLHNVK